MPAGTSTGPNDALTAARFMTTLIDTHLVKASLLLAGVSPGGTEQFSRGEVVTNAQDRLALARVVSSLLKRASTLP